ncbi:hypothetical protein E2C01_087547 [Portunus trituberculatus]|uniref:Uncharacterized protein n=1 Tax=Portunus trituberculatus TaxID=210409 RepID=A0A5B7JGN1_PORTR|nr:hypothetical protein [Portunus trituberculatus]
MGTANLTACSLLLGLPAGSERGRKGAGRRKCECILDCPIDPDILLREPREEVSNIKDGDYNASQPTPTHKAGQASQGQAGAALGMLITRAM